MSLHHCRAATTPAMPATGLSSAGASPFRLPASSSSAQGHLRLSPPAATASATACRRRLLLRCAASSGGGGGSGSDPVLEEQRRRQAELAARIASGEFTVQGPGSAAAHFPPHPPSFFTTGIDTRDRLEFTRWIAPLVGRLSKLGPPGELAAALLTRVAGAGGPEIPQAVGSINAVVGQAFFVPLYDLFLTYGGIFRLNFGPKVNAHTQSINQLLLACS